MNLPVSGGIWRSRCMRAVPSARSRASICSSCRMRAAITAGMSWNTRVSYVDSASQAESTSRGNPAQRSCARSQGVRVQRFGTPGTMLREGLFGEFAEHVRGYSEQFVPAAFGCQFREHGLGQRILVVVRKLRRLREG